MTTLIVVVVHRWFLYGLAGLALFLTQPLFAQKEGAIWYFGNHAGMDFNNFYPRPLTDGQTQSTGGVAAISDTTGNLLFYTDGQTIYTDTHGIMPGGSGLSGNNSATQSSLILPWPNHPNMYYVFTVGKLGAAFPGKGLHYSVVNLATRQVAPVNVQLRESCTEKITAIRHSNGRDWWILAHEINTSVFYEYLLSDNLVDQGIQVIGLKHQVNESDPNDKGASGYLKASMNGEMVALAIEGSKFFEIFKFQNVTGKLFLDPSPIKLSAESAYGVEFSPSGKYLYGTNRNDGTIYRWKLDNFTDLAVKASMKIIASDTTLPFGALQLAPDGKIYIAVDKKPWLSVIKNPDDDSCNFVKKGASLYDYTLKKKGISGFGLPNIPADFFNTDLRYTNNCVNDSTEITLVSTYLLDDIRTWVIDGNLIQAGYQSYRIKYMFKQPGVYPIKIYGVKDAVEVTFETKITIHPLPSFSIPDTTYLCSGQPVDLHSGEYAFYGIRNEAGVYTDSIRTADQPGLYTVIATNYQGCTDSVTTRAIAIIKPEIDSIAVRPASCTGLQNGSIRIYLHGNPADFNFKWADGSTKTDTRNDLAAGKYPVSITIKNGCQLDTTITVESSKLNVKLSRLPDGPDPVCPGTLIALSVTGADSYTWEHDPALTGNYTIVKPDTTTWYKVTGTDQTGKCFGYDSVMAAVLPNHSLDLGPDRSICTGDTIVLRGKDYDPGSNYRKWNWSTGEETDSLVIWDELANLQLRVEDKNGCIYTDEINILKNSVLTIQISSSPDVTDGICAGTPVTLTATGADSITWAHEPGIRQKSVVVYPVGDTIFRVRGTNGGSCYGEGSITIKVFPGHPLELGANRTVCSGDTVILRIADYNAQHYYTDWSWNPGGKKDSIIVTGTSPSLSLTVTDLNGCTYSDEIGLTFNPGPVITNVVPQEIFCNGDRGTLLIQVAGNPDLYQYSVKDPPEWTGTNFFEGLPAGDYVARARIENGCMSLAYPVTFTEPEKLEYTVKSISPTCTDCTDGEIRISATGGTKPYFFEWSGSSLRDSVNSDIGAGNYSLTLSDANGCKIEINLELTALELVIPTAFSPNGGTKNEKWMIRILENRSDCLVQVYDRSGKLVFVSDGPYVPWDGTYLNEGKALPSGTYFYLVMVDKTDANKPPQRGTVTILR